MDLISNFFYVFLHIDKFLGAFIGEYGLFIYLILFIIIFCETGLVIIPFLPGDYLLFAAGAFAALGNLNIVILIIFLGLAAILGDTVNYHIGRYLGPKVLKDDNKFLKKEYIDKTNKFYETYGGKTIILARFMPIIRTFAPFVAGVGKMDYKKFITFNAIGGIVWVSGISLIGYSFGNIPFVEKNFSIVIIAIIMISLLPAIFELIKNKFFK
ncbi:MULTISPECIES: DedA family protein [Clostridium]|uniref:DedA family protein n=1 Tax=Clostridium senegalense TaxID=1465809 RepID=A0A6M0H6H8_9CLOT|nr:MULTISPECIES: DedA family protein [Clostridium]NEU05894.1 DedA family protein [Clostridium senegalense]